MTPECNNLATMIGRWKLISLVRDIVEEYKDTIKKHQNGFDIVEETETKSFKEFTNIIFEELENFDNWKCDDVIITGIMVNAYELRGEFSVKVNNVYDEVKGIKESGFFQFGLSFELTKKGDPYPLFKCNRKKPIWLELKLELEKKK